MSSSDPKFLHRLIRGISGLAASSFFTEIRVVGGENVPQDGPIIVTATHHNMMLDPVILSVAFPHRRILNYWSKASLFANPIVRYILYSSGNIPVDRKSKDRQVLFKGTFEALSKGNAVALFPEGTSYTEPRIMQVKDGAAWASLEYAKWLKENPDKASSQDVTIIPAAIVYTNKSKYRSNLLSSRFGRPITMDAYKKQFFSGVDGDPRASVKRLTRAIENELIEMTINAPDWDTLYAARMARDILWEADKSIKLDEFTTISQTLVDLFSTPDATTNFTSARRHLLEYYSLLQSTHLTNSVLSALPLPRSLDPNTPATLPSRLLTLFLLIRDSVSILARTPFFLFPMIVHMPVYIMGRLGARLVEDEEETQAQNKVAFGLLALTLIYPATFFFLWALFWYTPTGALLAAGIVYLFAIYHIQMINGSAKRVIAAWRVLMGVWAPKTWEFSLAALSQYTTPLTPPENPWIDRPKTPVQPPANSKDVPSYSAPGSPRPADLLPAGVASKPEPPVRARPTRRPPSRRIMRHVLRARIEAVKALASFFDQLERAPEKRIKASAHLAKLYGVPAKTENVLSVPPTGAEAPTNPDGWRTAGEIVSFLRKRGANIPTTGHGLIEGEWAALSSEGEETPAEDQEITWVPPATRA
ncbi:hypothetical protein BD779DRAFT_1609793 [Infundibulicybe gibba]|nr:hypothetical protein BD779DRAFT_1609793 [Infundibulicybe gibba]